MAYHHSKLEAYRPHNQRRSGQIQQWYQSKSWKPPRKLSEKEYYQRQIKREREKRLGRCVTQITQDLNKLRNMQNSFIEDYFEGLNQNRVEKKDEMARLKSKVVVGVSSGGWQEVVGCGGKAGEWEKWGLRKWRETGRVYSTFERGLGTGVIF
nr:hypothetical protein [Tanacetum cinerariifolium]